MRVFALEGGEDLKGEIWEMIEGAAEAALDEYVPAGQRQKWDRAGLRRRIRGWGQKDPLVEYKQEAYDMFVDLMHDLRKTVARSGLRFGLHSRPGFLKSPMSSFFFVSTEIAGWPFFWNRPTASLMYRN